ncbi:MAG: carboxypeptidase-like regulatory domain-containing protein, partial [Planctomycetota bacterium]|nr:carboxypeptidase-like regulatory domain-containing protein [Planctomycetota bacterium]
GAQLVATAGPHDARQLFRPGARAHARSDARGRIDLRALGLDPERRYVVWAPDLAPALVPSGPGTATLRLLPAMPSEGLIRLARGRVAKQRELLAIPHAPYAELVHITRTDDTGRYRFPFLHAGGWSVFLRAGRGRLRPIGTVAAGGALGETRLEDATSIKGRILDGDGTRDASVGAVHVRLRALRGGGAEGQVDFATRADGRFLVSAIPEGVYELEMLDPAWAFEPTRPRVQVERGRARDLPAWFAVRRQRVLGSVRDEDGAPLAGVSVRLVPEPGRRLAPGARAEGTPPVKSDPAGRFVVRGVAPGEGYRLIAAAKGRSPFTSATFRVDRAEPTQLKPFRLRGGWRVQLRVRDLDGDPVVGAQVIATSARRPSAIGDPLWRDTVREGRTDDTGRLLLGDLPEDDVLLQVRAARYEPGSLVVAYPRVSDMRRAELTLAPATSLDGQLSVPEGGLAGPFVVEAQRRDGGKAVRAEAGADGRFRFADLVDTSYDVRVLRVGKDKHEELLVTLEGVVPGAETLLEIRLPELRALSGSVETLAPDGPVPEVVVETRIYNAGLQRYVWRAAARMRLERDGTRALFTVPGLPPGEYSVRVLQGPLDTGTTTVVLDESDIDGLQLRMPAGARLAGAVRDAEGAALLGARIRLTRLHGEHPAPLKREAPLQRRADERGDFMFEGLAPGQWRVEASDDERASHVEIVRLHDGEVLVLDDLALGAGARIAGEVADAEGRPLDGVHVHARRFDGDGAPQIFRTDAEGRFLARHVRPGAWLLKVDAATVAGGPWIEALVEAVADETATVQFTAGEDGAVRGTVRRRGAPVSGAIVELIHEPYEEGAAVRRYRASTGAEGRFAVENLEAGRYTLQLQSGAWRSTQGVDLEAGDELDLDLEAYDARLRGRVVTRDGRLVGGASVVATPLDAQGRVQPGSGFVGEGRSDPRGTFMLAGLPPGPYTLAVSAPGLPPGRFHGAQADLPGADFSIEVVLGRGGDVVLRLEDENERGVTGARVWIEDPEGVALHRTPYVTGAAGRLRIEGVTPGAVRLRVHARGLGRPALRALVVEEGGEHAVRMRLLPAGGIRLTVRGETDDPLARTRIDILRAGSEDVIARRLPLGPIRLAAPWGWVPRTGIATIGDLEAGTYIARISAGRRYAVAEVPIEVKTGLTAEVRVTLAPR